MLLKKVLEAVDLVGLKRSDSDYIDRLNHRWSSVLLIVTCVLMTTANYGNLPMFCWCPAYFVTAYERYTQKICWVSETYNIIDDSIVTARSSFPATGAGPRLAASDSSGDANGDRYYDNNNYRQQQQQGQFYQKQQQQQASRKKVLRVSYYQWIPLLLLLQSLFFYLPGLLWRTLAARSGLDLANIVEASDTVQNAIYPERRDKTLRYMSRHINRFLTYQTNYRGGTCRWLKGFMARRLCLCCGNRFGNYLTALYIGLKVVNVLNVIVQILFIDFYLGSHFHLLGVAFLQGLSSNESVTTPTALSSNHPVLAHNPPLQGSHYGIGGNVAFAPANHVRFLREVDHKTNQTESILKNFNSTDLFSSYRLKNYTNYIGSGYNKTSPSDSSSRQKRLNAAPQQRFNRRRPTTPLTTGRNSFDWAGYKTSLRSFPYLSSRLFPKVTFCDFTIRQMTSLQLFTTQCVLSINFVNEKLFLLLWFWFCLLLIFNLLSLIVWTVRLCSRRSRENYVRRQLAMIQKKGYIDSASFDRRPVNDPQVETSVAPLSEEIEGDKATTALVTEHETTEEAENDNKKAAVLLLTCQPQQLGATSAEVKFLEEPQQLQTLTPLRFAPSPRRLVKFDKREDPMIREFSFDEAVRSFAHNRLKHDGVFILKMLAANTTRLVELDVMAMLWSVHERRLATGDLGYYFGYGQDINNHSRTRTESLAERRDTVVDVTELRRARLELLARDV